jgi:hypothetical protein
MKVSMPTERAMSLLTSSEFADMPMMGTLRRRFMALLYCDEDEVGRASGTLRSALSNRSLPSPGAVAVTSAAVTMVEVEVEADGKAGVEVLAGMPGCVRVDTGADVLLLAVGRIASVSERGVVSVDFTRAS